MNKFKAGLVITGLGLIVSIVFFYSGFADSSNIFIAFLPAICGGVFILGNVVLSANFGNKISHFFTAGPLIILIYTLMGVSNDSLTPNNGTKLLVLSIFLLLMGWLHLVYLYKNKYE